MQPERPEARVMKAIYRLGSRGRKTVTEAQLVELGIPKLEIFDATETGMRRNMIIQGSNGWIMIYRGRLFVEGLLEEEKRLRELREGHPEL